MKQTNKPKQLIKQPIKPKSKTISNKQNQQTQTKRKKHQVKTDKQKNNQFSQKNHQPNAKNQLNILNKTPMKVHKSQSQTLNKTQNHITHQHQSLKQP